MNVARSLKTAGMKELGNLQKRVRRQRTMCRIGEEDFNYINERLKQIEARIISMYEEDEPGKEDEEWL